MRIARRRPSADASKRAERAPRLSSCARADGARDAGRAADVAGVEIESSPSVKTTRQARRVIGAPGPGRSFDLKLPDEGLGWNDELRGGQRGAGIRGPAVGLVLRVRRPLRGAHATPPRIAPKSRSISAGPSHDPASAQEFGVHPSPLAATAGHRRTL